MALIIEKRGMSRTLYLLGFFLYTAEIVTKYIVHLFTSIEENSITSNDYARAPPRGAFIFLYFYNVLIYNLNVLLK